MTPPLLTPPLTHFYIGLCGVVGGMMVIELLAGTMRLDRISPEAVGRAARFACRVAIRLPDELREEPCEARSQEAERMPWQGCNLRGRLRGSLRGRLGDKKNNPSGIGRVVFWLCLCDYTRRRRRASPATPSSTSSPVVGSGMTGGVGALDIYQVLPPRKVVVSSGATVGLPSEYVAVVSCEA